MVPRTEATKAEVMRLMHAVPFRRFVLNMENGDRVQIEHPENIAFDSAPTSKSSEFYVLSGKIRLFSNFEAVSSVELADRNGSVAE